jgi:hypothetical protein
VPAARARTDIGGANSESCTSQCCAVVMIASSALVGHAGTENGAVAMLETGGMICDGPGM